MCRKGNDSKSSIAYFYKNSHISYNNVINHIFIRILSSQMGWQYDCAEAWLLCKHEYTSSSLQHLNGHSACIHQCWECKHRMILGALWKSRAVRVYIHSHIHVLTKIKFIENISILSNLIWWKIFPLIINHLLLKNFES